MATAQRPTLIDLASRLDPSGQLIHIAEVLRKKDPILDHITWQECNKTDGFMHGIRTGIPAPTWRKMYQGVQPTKSTTATVTDTCGNLEAYAEVDKDLADINGNTYAWRMSEQTPFFDAFANTMAETFFYGDTDKNPERFMSLAPRYNTLSTKTPIHRNVLSFGHTGSDLTSIYIVNHNVFFGIYPKASKVGLQHTDKGQVTIQAADGGNYEAYRDHYKWQAGACLEDWRGCVRVCNLSLSKLTDGTLTADELIKKLIEAKNRIPSSLRQNLHMYVPEEVKTALEIAAYEKSTSAVKIVEAAGQFKTHFFDIPIEVCDSISKSETQVK